MASLFVSRPGVCGGEPTLPGTRLTVIGFRGRVKADGIDELILEYPHVPYDTLIQAMDEVMEGWMIVQWDVIYDGEIRPTYYAATGRGDSTPPVLTDAFKTRQGALAQLPPQPHNKHVMPWSEEHPQPPLLAWRRLAAEAIKNLNAKIRQTEYGAYHGWQE